MPEQENTETSNHSAFARFMMEGDGIHKAAPVEMLAVLATVGAGAVVYTGVHNYVFPGHFEHDDQEAFIRAQKAEVADLQDTKEDLAEINGTAGLDTTDEQGNIDQQIIAKQADIQTQIDHPVPEGYNSTVDSIVSSSAGVLAFAVAGVAVFKGLKWAYQNYNSSRPSAEADAIN